MAPLLRIIACTLIVWVGEGLSSPAEAAEKSMPDGVLIIHSNQRPTPAAIVIEDTLRKVVPDALGRPVELFSEYLDVERSSMENYAEAVADFLRQKYAGRNVRVIVAVAPAAISFAVNFRDRMLNGAPVVHIAAPSDLVKKLVLPADFVGRSIDLDPRSTFELALRLHPRTKRLVIVEGIAERDRLWGRRIRAAIASLPNGLEVEYLSGMPTGEVLQRLGALGSDTIVYTAGYFLDGAGAITTPRRSLELIAGASAAPVYGPLDTFLGTGIVGGYMSAYDEQARQGGAIVVRLLNGTAPSAIAAETITNVPMVDWRQIRRWNIDQRLLPGDTVVRFREPSVWDTYRWQISVAIAVLLLQAGLIAGLLVQRKRRRDAEQIANSLRSDFAHASRLTMAGELTASIAHEINQPLGAILSNAEAADLLLQSSEDRRDLLRQILADIRRDDIRASEVIRRLRGLLAKHEVEQKPFDLSAAVSEAVAMIRLEAERRGVSVDVQLAPIATVIGDQVQLQQVVINLLFNAMEAVADQSEGRRTVAVDVKQSGTQIVMSVRDRGHGVSRDDVPKLFDSFFSTKRSGMGLGLSVARTIVQAHGGRIWVESTLGDGAVFGVELPAADRVSTKEAEVTA